MTKIFVSPRIQIGSIVIRHKSTKKYLTRSVTDLHTIHHFENSQKLMFWPDLIMPSLCK